MAILRRLTSNLKIRLFDPVLAQDYAHNTFTARVRNEGNETNTYIIVSKQTPQGVETDIATIRSDAGKLESGVGMIRVGADLKLRATAHETDFITNEQEHYVRGVCVPFPGGLEPDDAPAGAFMGDGGTTVDPVDYARIVREVDAAEQDDYTRIIGNMMGKAQAGAENAIKAGGSFEVWQQLINTSYTGALAAIRDSGLAVKFTPAALATLAALDAVNNRAAEEPKA